MKRLLLALTLFTFHFSHFTSAAEPLRVFIRSGPKSHGPGAHDYPQFLKDWVPMLNERGAKAAGKNGFPTKEELDATDVLVLHSQEAGNIAIGEERKNLLDFLKRGGGIVVIHAGIVSRDAAWFKTIAGGSWNHATPTKWLEGPMSLYFTDHENPITRGISNFDMDDEIYYDMDVLPEVKILAGAYTPNKTGARNAKKADESTKGGKQVSIYDIQPQMWTYEKEDYRAFVCIPGHYYTNFSHNGFRTAILRGIAWAGKRDNADLLCKPEELGDALRYVEGGPPRPQDMLKHLEVHPEFNLSLVAAEPLINKPMNIDWDEKGRLWVCETPEYPNGRRLPKDDTAATDVWKDSGSIAPGKYDRDPLDRISILSDSDGDGIMDKKHVFADKLELCTSFCFYKNGVIACSAPDIWFLEDTDGDDTADKRTKLYTGLGTGDTHAVINNLRWGLDGWVYATHGYSAGDVTCLGAGGARSDGVMEKGSDGKASKTNTPTLQHSNTPVHIGSGVVRFKPDGTQIEQYASRGGNTWGLDITWDGQVFYTQPTSGNHFIHVVLPEYVLAKGKLPGVMGTNGLLPKEPTYPAMKWEQQAYVQIDQVGSYTAAAGCAIYEGGAWPAKWNYGYFTTEPTINIVSHFMVEPDGVTYKAHREPGREQTEFIRSKNLWFRPIEVRVGPDGALYVVDFCNQAVIHNDTRGPAHGPANAAVRPDRDHYFGRIWKVQHKEAKKLPAVPAIDTKKLASGDGGEIDKITLFLDAYPNAHVRQTWYRLLSESKAEGIILEKRLGSQAQKLFENIEFDCYPRTPSPFPGGKPSDNSEGKPSDNSERLQEHLTTWSKATDSWTKSAIVGGMAREAVKGIQLALARPDSREFATFAQALLSSTMNEDATSKTTKLLTACAEAPSSADALKAVILQALA
ncbi:MAG: PVC-type heme-binding CxxCH protein, partial [Roseimicrobium sp.]